MTHWICLIVVKAKFKSLQKQRAIVCYNDPLFPTVGRGRKYDLQIEEHSIEAD